jgi:hypothetical protein
MSLSMVVGSGGLVGAHLGDVQVHVQVEDVKKFYRTQNAIRIKISNAEFCDREVSTNLFDPILLTKKIYLSS